MSLCSSHSILTTNPVVCIFYKKNKTCSCNEERPQPHTQHLKEIERGGDKKKQKKWDKQKAQNQMVEIS